MQGIEKSKGKSKEREDCIKDFQSETLFKNRPFLSQ
jgi:hypothetical protein